MSNALDTQVAGSHYHDNFKMQPIELITLCKWNFIQGNIAKYTLRAPYKNGDEDLKKAMHYCDLGLELDETPMTEAKPPFANTQLIELFAKINGIGDDLHNILHVVNRKEYYAAYNKIIDLLSIEK